MLAQWNTELLSGRSRVNTLIDQFAPSDVVQKQILSPFKLGRKMVREHRPFRGKSDFVPLLTRGSLLGVLRATDGRSGIIRALKSRIPRHKTVSQSVRVWGSGSTVKF